MVWKTLRIIKKYIGIHITMKLQQWNRHKNIRTCQIDRNPKNQRTEI